MNQEHRKVKFQNTHNGLEYWDYLPIPMFCHISDQMVADANRLRDNEDVPLESKVNCLIDLIADAYSNWHEEEKELREKAIAEQQDEMNDGNA